MLTREEIISGFKKVNFPEKIFDSSISEVKNIIFYSESKEPNSKKEKDVQNLMQSYVLPRRLIQKNYNDNFIRGSNFIPKEPIVDIKIENLKLLYNKYEIPIETGIIYFKNNYGGLNGPYNLSQVQNMYNNKKIDSNYEFRTIDIFAFKDCDVFTFKSIKTINEDNWTDLIIYSPLLKYDKFTIKDTQKEEEKSAKIEKEVLINGEKKENIIKEEKKEDIIKEEKKENIIKEEKKAEKREEKKEDKEEEKKESNIKKEEEKWEVVAKKKNKSNKEKEVEEEENEIIGLKNKVSKEIKKGKKKKKGKFEDADFELGFKIK